MKALAILAECGPDLVTMSAEISKREAIPRKFLEAPVPCSSRAGHPRCAECKGQGVCGVRLVLAELHEATARFLDHTTLADLMLRTHQAAEHAPGYAN